MKNNSGGLLAKVGRNVYLCIKLNNKHANTMSHIKTKEVTIQDLLNYLSQFPKDAVVCTHNSRAWFHNRVRPINESDMTYFIQKVENPINDCGKPLKQVFVSIHDYCQPDY